MSSLPSEHLEDLVFLRAAHAGFRLVQHENDTGQLIWEWRLSNGPRPQFVTRRIAIHWMMQLLEGNSDVPFVSSAGLSY